jgi:hypothetical protein
MGETPSFDESAWRESLMASRAATLAIFRDPRLSPYAAVGRHEFAGSKPLVFGSDEACDVVIADLDPRAFQIFVDGEGFECQADGLNTTFRVIHKGVTSEPQQRLRIQAGARVLVGRYSLRFSHQNFPAVLVLDPESSRLQDAAPPLWFDPDPRFRIEARLERDPAPREEIVQSTRGQQRRALKLGLLVFEFAGKTHKLSALRMLEPGSDEAGFSIFFRDETSGHESYPVGRYLEPKPVGAAGGEGDRWLLDFNTAYNPACAFSELYNCPVPPRENRLAMAIRAGERDPHPTEDAHG